MGCAYCGQIQGHSPRCSVTKFNAPEQWVSDASAPPVGSRVTHVDPNGKALPMAGTVVGIDVRYLVEWDGEEPRPTSGWTPTYYYPADVLRVLP